MSNWQSAFVTGGGSGIGLRLTELLLAEGTNVAVFSLNYSDQVRASLLRCSAQAGAGKHVLYEVDVCDTVGVEAAVSSAVAAVGKPDLAINCAGVQLAKHFAELSSNEFDFVIKVNLLGSRNVAAAILPHMGRGGQFAFVASLAGLVSSYSYAAYNASKFGVVGLAGALRLDYIASGIEVSVICPPEVNTPMVVAERKTMTEASRKLKATAGTLELVPACDLIMKELRQRKVFIIPGVRAKLVAFAARHLPGIMRLFSEKIVIANV